MKAKLKTGEIIDVVFTRLSPHVIELIFMSLIWPTTEEVLGFKIVRDNGDTLFDGTNYDTLYRETSEGYQLSDDGSVYVEPEPAPEPAPEPEPMPDVSESDQKPTIKERVTDMENHVYKNI